MKKNTTFRVINSPENISLFVKNILVFEGGEKNQSTDLPFFPDGYPGMMFHESEGLCVYPHMKEMPAFCVYGQKIYPIELQLKGKFNIITFQFYPFILRIFFNLSAVDLNGDCYDLQQQSGGNEILSKLLSEQDINNRINIISDYLYSIFLERQNKLDLAIKQGIQLILDSNGQIAVKDICDTLYITERTFQRRFLKETGFLPKQFSKIIKFQSVLEHISGNESSKLTEIIYNNGFSDQSHMIKVFKAYTGKTPKKYIQMAR